MRIGRPKCFRDLTPYFPSGTIIAKFISMLKRETALLVITLLLAPALLRAEGSRPA